MDWDEADTELFIDEGAYFVPERELQIGIIRDLVPADGPGRIVELCCGEGLLTRALLERFPDAVVHALDGSPTMLGKTAERAGEYQERLETGLFDLAADDWRSPAYAVRAVVSSLAVHHLDGGQKRTLFADIARILRPGGVFVLADLIAPVTASGTEVAARTWDEAVERRALELDGTTAAFDRFTGAGWNHFRTPDPVDRPSPLLDQLKWLEAAGFGSLDVHWMKAGHAIVSGVARGHETP